MDFSVIVILAAFVVTWVGLQAILRSPIALRAGDEPNERSLHQGVIPRVGGIGIGLGVLLAAALLWPGFDRGLLAALLGAVILGVVSWIDDTRKLSPLPRLIAHLLVAATWLLVQDTPWFWLLPGVLVFGWSMNLYNFMDGSDGLAGGMALFGFGAFAVAAHLGGAPVLAAWCAAIGAAAFAFLLFNFHPARVFLGDCGSVPLGFLAAALGWYGWQHAAWGPFMPLIAFLPFVFDASVTLARRVARGERPWRAHREHFYQRAIQSGLGHARTAQGAYVLMMVCAVTAVVVRGAGLGTQLAAAAGLAGLCACVAWFVERRFRASRALHQG